MLHPQPQRGQILTFPSTEVAPMTPTQSKRGGKREPLPRLTITIPNYGKYMPPVKGRKRWIRSQVDLPRDPDMREAFRITRSKSPKSVFEYLIGQADNDGQIAGLHLGDAATDTGMDYRTIAAAVEALAKVGLIKGFASNPQVTLKEGSSKAQVIPLEDLRQSLGLTPPTVNKRQETNTITPLKPPFGDSGKAPPAEPSADVVLARLPIKSGGEFVVTEGFIADLATKFPTVPDLRASVLAACAWIEEDPKRRKVNYQRFFGNWMRNRLNQPAKPSVSSQSAMTPYKSLVEEFGV